MTKSSRVIIAPEYLKTYDSPLIFLAGPIPGSRDWQSDAIKTLEKTSRDIIIASPRRPILAKDFTDTMHSEQVDWETYHLRKAACNDHIGEKGVILFWLAKESQHNCERAYAQTTRFELAEWKIRHERDGTNLVIGVEEGFTGSRYILRRFSQDAPKVPICHTLEDTCKAAVKLIHRDEPQMSVFYF